MAGCGATDSATENVQDHSTSGEPATSNLHIVWDELLQTHVDEEGLVDYKALAKAPGRLDEYLKLLGRTDPASLGRNDRLAYWINAYNAFTIKLILNHYPVKSIKDIPRRWEARNWVAGGKRYSLNQIEHEILRKDFEEPRIHFAIVCASIGCPNLWNRAFAEDELDRQLAQAGKTFFASPKHLRFETRRGAFGGNVSVLNLSRILKWFKEDFTDDGKTSVTDFVLKFVDTSTAAKISQAGDDIKIKYLGYDWGLNEK